MSIFRRSIVLGALAPLLAASLLPAADSLTRTVPLRWVGGAPAAVVHIDRLDSSNNVAESLDVAPVGSALDLPRTRGAARYRFRADGFTPVDLAPERLEYGVVLRAYGSVLVEMPVQAAGSPPKKITVFVVESRREPRGVTLTVEPGPGGEYSFRCPPGIWHVLVDAGAGEPRIVEGVRVPPGESARVPSAGSSAGQERTFRVTDAHGAPVPEASFQWRAKPDSPADALLKRWARSRNLHTGRDGRVRIDRMPSRSHSWEVVARGFHTKTVEVHALDGSAAAGPEASVKVALRQLPSLRVRLRGAGEPSAGALSLWRIPRLSAEAVKANDQPVWTGRIGSEAIVPGLAGGLYRAEARLAGLVAAGEATVDDSDAGSDVQDLVIEVVKKLVTGHVSKSGVPLEDAVIEAVPGDSAITPSTTRLAKGRTGADGRYALSFSYRGTVSVFAASESASKAKDVDLTSATEAQADFDFRPARLRVHVADAATGAELASADVTAEFVPAGGSSEGIRTGKTDSEGDFLLDDLSEGSLKIATQADGYARRILRDVPAPSEGESVVRVELTRRASFRIRVLDEFGAPVAGAEVQVPRDAWMRASRVTSLKSLGRTNEFGELVLDDLRGEQTPAFAVGAGLTVEAFWLPASADPGGEDERNTADVLLTHYGVSPGIVLRGSGGASRDDAFVVFQKDGIEVPLSALALAAQLNGLSPESLFQRGDHAIHYHELLAPGTYLVDVLTPRQEADYDPARDFRDSLGSLVLPPSRTVELVWKEDRPYPPAAPR